MSDWPFVSVIVPARDAAATLPACLASLRALDYLHYEIIVADDGSSDGSDRLAEAAGALVLRVGGRGPSIARNVALAAAAGTLIAFTDADCTVPRSWLRRLVTAQRETGAAGVGGGQRNILPKGRGSRELDAFFAAAAWVSAYARRGRRRQAVQHVPSCNALYRRDVLEAVGGFAPDLFPGEDVELDYRLSRLAYRLYYVPDVEVAHHRPGTSAWFAAWMRAYGAAQRELVRRHGPFRALHYLPAALVALAAVQLLLIPRVTRGALVAADLTVLACAAIPVLRSGPPRVWPAVVRYASRALLEWHRGYLGAREAR